MKLTLPLPPSINRLTRAGVNRKSGRVYKPGAKLAEEYKGWVLMAVMAAGVATKDFGGELVLIIDWYYGKGARPDIDNGIKLLVDSLAGAIGFNDRQIVRLHVYRWPEVVEHPHCEIELKEMGYGD